MSIKEKQGIKPQLRDYLALQEKALAGDIVMVIDPETVGSATTVTQRVVKVSIETAGGEVHDWLNSTYATTVSKADVTAGDGTSAIDSTTLTLVNGVGSVVVTYADTWAADDTQTVTIANITVAGVTVTGGTSVDTIV